MSNLRTNYKDDVFSGSRKYRTVNNADGTVSFTDETTYTQRGDTYGAAQINQSNEIINSLDNNAYKSTDAAMTDIADNDYIPIYDTSASAKKKTLWSNIKTLLTQAYAIKVHDSNSAGTYGAGTSSRFGHVKLSDNYTSSAGNASQSVGASSQAVYNTYDASTTRYNEVVGELTANNRRIYMDYKNGKYGYNTSAKRGADTFFPFSDMTEVYNALVSIGVRPASTSVEDVVNAILSSVSPKSRTFTANCRGSARGWTSYGGVQDCHFNDDIPCTVTINGNTISIDGSQGEGGYAVNVHTV